MRLIIAFLLCSMPLIAGEEIPGAPQKQPIVLQNATVHTITNGILQNATVVFDAGVITQVGTSVTLPENARIIDCSGKHIYPGFIAPTTTLGLTELDAVRATRDMNEVGTHNPNARAETAYNPDSELIPTIRSNGILMANVTPGGGRIAGTASLMRLDGWTREDIAILPKSALVLSWPQMDVITAWWMQKSAEDQQKDFTKDILELYQLVDQAIAYNAVVSAGDSSKKDIRFEAWRPVLRNEIPLLINAESQQQILAVLDFQRKYKLKVILNGASEAPEVLDELQRSGIPVIINRVHSLPRRDEDLYDDPFTLPSKLAAAKIMFAFSEDGAWQQRNLPFHAGTAMAFGLSEEVADKALTLWPATMLGVEKQYGSIEVGKKATLFVSKGMALDALTNVVEHAFIDGKTVELRNRHTRLSEKYRARYKQ